MYKVSPDRLFNSENAQKHRQQMLTQVADSIKQVQETESGYSLRFSSNNQDIVLVSDWMQAERICNPFLRFMLTVESNQGPIFCELGGPSGTKSFLSTTLGLNRWL